MIKDHVKSILRISSAHNKETHRYKHCPNFASFEIFLIETFSSLYSFTIANQKSVRYSVSIYVLFYKYSKCKQRICLHYGLDMVLK
jgi:hypothetical protein